MLAGGGGRMRAHEVGGVLQQHAGRLALSSSRTMMPPSGFGVSLVMPASSSALRVDGDDVAAARDEHRIVRRDRIELVPRRHAAFFEDALVPAGARPSPICPARVRATRSPIAFCTSATDLRAEQLHRRAVQARRTADAGACRSGPARRSCRRARSPACSGRCGGRIASSSPTARKRPSRIATASAMRQSLSTVIILPPRSTRSAGCARAGEARRVRRRARRNA